MNEQATEQVAEQVAEAPQVAEWTPEVEEEARAFGWKSPDEWQGEVPPTYIGDPRRFLERAENFTPFKRLKERADKDAKDFQERLRKIEAVAMSAVDRARKDAERDVAQIKAEQRKAVETGDVAQFDELQRKAEALQKDMAPAAPVKPSGIPPEVKAAIDHWAVGKDWFGKDRVKTAAASAAYQEALDNGLTDPAACLAHVDKRMAVDAPKPQMSAVEGGLMLGSGGKGSFTKLPKEAQEAFSKFVAKGLFKDDEAGRKAYMEDYNAA